MKLFLGIHLLFWFVWTTYVVLWSEWSGSTEEYVHSFIPFVLVLSHIEVLPFSAFLFLFAFFIKNTLDFKVKRK